MWSALRLSAVERIQAALFVSLALHAAILLGVYFRPPDAKHFKDNQNTLEVVLVNSKSGEKPRDALALAQANLDGGGNTDDIRRARSPLPVFDDDNASKNVSLPDQVERAAKHVAALEEQSKHLLTQLKAERKIAVNAVNPRVADPTLDAAPDAQNQTEDVPPLPTHRMNPQSRQREIMRLEAQISKSWDEYQKRPKRKFIGARTQEYRFAQYIEDWRTKVERVGNQNYPEAARQRKIYGSLLATIAIRANGEIENVEIVRSSGHRVLDAAVLHIIELSAPFAPFPDAVRNDTDVLHITRTWTFTRADQLVSE